MLLRFKIVKRSLLANLGLLSVGSSYCANNMWRDDRRVTLWTNNISIWAKCLVQQLIVLLYFRNTSGYL